MSDNIETQTAGNSNEWTDWIEEAISKKHIKYYEYKYFHNIQKIGKGAFGKIYRANWKEWEQYLVLKSLFNLNNNAVKEIVQELKLHREVDSHNNIISFYGVTSEENPNGQLKKYSLVMEYADGDTLQNYLEENFMILTWGDKYKLAYQLASAVSCLHGEGIVHRDLHSSNILIHQKTIKLSDFGLSKRINEASNIQSKLMGIIPYIDPKRYNKGKKGDTLQKSKFIDVYSIGVLFWEISSGRRPFENRDYDFYLAIDIREGLRETPVPDTPKDYIKLYTECWNGEPNNRPAMGQVVARLKAIKDNRQLNLGNVDTSLNNNKSPHEELFQNFGKMNNSDNADISSNINSELRGELSQMIQNIDKINIKDIDLSLIVDELIDFHYKDLDKGEEVKVLNQYIFDYFNNQNITLDEIYNWLLNNQNDSNSYYLFGYFNYHGIGTSIDKQKAFELFQKAANLGNRISQYNLANTYKDGKGVNKDKDQAIYWYKKSAEQGFKKAENELKILKQEHQQEQQFSIIIDEIINIHCKDLNKGEEVKVLNQHIFDYFDNQNITSHETYNRLLIYQNDSNSFYLLGYFNYHGIGTSIDKQKAFKLFQKAANLGNSIAQRNLAYMYKNGEGVGKDYSKAFKLAKKSAEGGYSGGITMLGYCYNNGIGISINKKKALELYQKAANLGNIVAQRNLGHKYRSGKGIDKGYNNKAFKKSVKVGHIGASVDRQKPANLENSVAQCNLANKRKSEKDIDKEAFELLKQSAEEGHSNGINGVGFCYQYGIGTNIDKQKAFELYQKAANLGNSESQCNLAYMYRNGEGVDEDKDQAIYWYKKSAEQGYQKAENELKILEQEH